MTNESPSENNPPKEIDCWPTQLESTIEVSPKHSKLLSALKKSIENGEEALQNEEYQLARFCFESAEQAAIQLLERDWSNTHAKKRLKDETLPTIQTVLSKLEDRTEPTTVSV